MIRRESSTTEPRWLAWLVAAGVAAGLGAVWSADGSGPQDGARERETARVPRTARDPAAGQDDPRQTDPRQDGRQQQRERGRGDAGAQDTGTKGDRDRRPSATRSESGTRDGEAGPTEVTADREEAAMAFVREHHPELTQLLVYLKENQPRQYRLAITDLWRTSERLAGFRERDPDRHRIELEAWKLESRIELLVARLRMRPDDARLQRQLRGALDQQVDIRKSLLEDRIQRLQAQLDRLDEDREREVERRFRMLTQPPRTRAERPQDDDASAPAKTTPPDRDRAPERGV